MKKLWALVLAVGMMLTLVGCSGGQTTTDTTGSAPASDAPADASGDVTFTIAVGGEPNFIDPAVIDDSATGTVTNNLYYPLFQTSESGELVNAACTSYELAEDGITYTFHLREDNYWSDGQQVVAGDYVYNMKRAVGFGSSDAYYSYFITDYVAGGDLYKDQGADIADMTELGITAPDDFTIQIVLKQPTPYFVDMMRMSVFLPVRQDIAKEHDSTWAGDVNNLITNGPFYVESFDSTSQYVLKKNPYFFDKDNIKIDTLIVKVIVDMDAQMIAFQSGELDLTSSLSTSAAQAYAGSPELIFAPSVASYYTLVNSFGDNVALQDPKVRQALSLAIDREAIVTTLDCGDLYYPLYGFIPKGFPGVSGDFRDEQDKENQLTSYDPEKAMALLEEAGYGPDNPVSFTYYYNSNALHDTVAQIIQQQWAAIGVNVTLKTGELRTFFDDRDNGLFEMARGGFSADYMDVSNYLDLGRPSTQATHVGGDEKFEQMVDDGNLLEGVDRLAAMHEAETYLIQEQAYYIPLIGYGDVYLMKEGTQGIVWYSNGGHNIWYASPAE